MGERRGTKALELWCRRITDGYPGVNVQNMTTSWRDGLAFCAMIHHFRPDLIDFDSLNKDDIYGNNELAFRIAEQHLGIPALLDAEDMASCAVPDRLSILTYLSQFYQSFGVSSPTRLALNRTTESSSERIAPVPESPKPKMGSRLGMRRDPCAVCGLPVFLAEKLVISRMPYHRTCFRCARCKNQLTPGNYYETEDGQYCCETCPDEEALATCFSPPPTTANDDILQKSLSDEEKIGKSIDPKILQTPQTASSSSPNDNDDNDSNDISLSSAQEMRLKFIESNLLAEKLSIFDNDVVSSGNDATALELSAAPNSSALRRLMMSDAENSDPAINDDQRLTAISSHDVDFKCLDDKTNTKDLDGEAATASLVQQRLKMFESQDKKLKVANTVKPALSKRDLKSFFPQEKNQEENFEVDENDENVEIGENDEIDEIDEVDENDSLTVDVKNPSECGQRGTKLKRMDTLEAEFERLLESNSIESEQVFLNESEEAKIFNPPETDVKLESKDTIQSQEREEEEEEIEIDKNHSRNQLPKADEMNLFTAKGINLSDVDNYPEELNPFADDEMVNDVNESRKNGSKISTNPFDNSSDDNEEEIMKIQETRIKRRLKAPEISLNPFSSEDDDDDDDEYNNDTNNTKGKNIERDKNVPINFPVPKPRTINLITSKQNLERSGMYASNTSLASCGSTPGASSRKKKPAPQPPTKEILSSPHSNPTTPKRNSSINTTNSSPHMTPRMRKSKPAPPPPPILTSTPQNESLLSHINCNESPIQELISDDDLCKLNMWEDQKSNKDEVNRTRQSLTCHDSQSYASYADKSVQGKWKRKKGPAPPRPVPLRRKIKVLSMKDIKLELDQIELQQQGLERQGVRLEQIIRDKSESKANGEDSNLDGDVEELVLELFVLVNEKNELFRRQAELMLLRRQQRLEEEHADVEYQIRCLMCQPEATKTDFDKQREETLIQRLVQIVERRNEIVECLEMDRKREVEEDRSINKHMGLYAAKGKSDTSSDNDVNRPSKTKKGKLKEKLKEKKLKKSHKKDADKDVDEAELKLKRHNKKKWF